MVVSFNACNLFTSIDESDALLAAFSSVIRSGVYKFLVCQYINLILMNETVVVSELLIRSPEV